MPLSHESRCRLNHPEYFKDGEVFCDCRHKEKDPLPRVAYCSFSCYPGDDDDVSRQWRQSLSLMEIVNLSMETGDLWARHENSGCESTYVEVARWSHDRERWERFAHEKMMDVEFIDSDGEPIELSDDEKAERIVTLINTETDFSFIHGLPGWEGAKS